MVCEKCWDEFRRRQLTGAAVTYSEVVVESDRRGGCTPAEQCGDRHDTLPGTDGVERCRCGAVERATPSAAPAPPTPEETTHADQ